MEFERLAIKDVILCKPTVHKDERGYFVETFRQDLLDNFLGFKINFVQDNESLSSFGVLRGLHYQLPPFAQSKLVRVIEGEVLDIAVDIRKNSPTFGSFTGVMLNSENKHQLFIPRGFAHGFAVLSKTAVFAYKVDNYYSKECDRGLFYDDFGINWGLDKAKRILSSKDLNWPNFSQAKELFEFEINYYA
ncbi:MAG: dTDP-4-dehydrorhamnose 3,5-epimerase [Campylobacteraceae bacterium]|nr:dTDP-4-dehydrorhamnose 3,5-epimerase [Campylobacteraceae bacterium]